MSTRPSSLRTSIFSLALVLGFVFNAACEPEPEAKKDAGTKPDAACQTGSIDCECLADGSCLDGDNGAAYTNPKFLEFIDLFEGNGHLASVCETDYEPFFAAALPIIDEVCEDFVPEG